MEAKDYAVLWLPLPLEDRPALQDYKNVIVIKIALFVIHITVTGNNMDESRLLHCYLVMAAILDILRMCKRQICIR